MDDERPNQFKIPATILVAIICIIAAGYWGRPAYRHFKEQRYQARAQAAYDRGDFANALLGVRLTLVLNSNNVPACRLMARLAEAAHSPEALDCWRRVAELEPTVDNQLSLASTAMRYQSPPYPLTSQILGDLAASANNLENYHLVCAELALALRRMADAQTHFDAASRLNPTNQIYQLDLATLAVTSTNPATAGAARERLKQFCTDTNFSALALRSLITDRLLHDDFPGAYNFSTQLLAGANSTLNDRLQQLAILQRWQNPELASRLAALQSAAATNAVMTAQLAAWMQANGLRAAAVAWLNRLPAKTQAQPVARIALVECLLAGGDWKAMRDVASKDSWGELEFLRLAYLSRAWSGLGEPMVADSDWNSAAGLAGNQFGELTVLLDLAGRWGMNREQEDLLWHIVRRFPDAAWAQQALAKIYFNTGNTKGLYELFGERLRFSPQDLKLKNNLAATALLLKTNLNQACRWAAESYAQNTNDPVIVSTYAYALHLQGRDRDGLAALQKLGTAALEQPSVALYYGVLLTANGRRDEAAPFLEIARKTSLLPEEKLLLAQTVGTK